MKRRMLLVATLCFLFLSNVTVLCAGLLDGTCWRGDVYIDDRYAFTHHLAFYDNYIYAAVSHPDLYFHRIYNRYAFPYQASENSDGTIDYFCIGVSRRHYAFYWGVCAVEAGKCSFNAYGMSFWTPVSINQEEYELMATDWEPRDIFIPY